jgi:hypothetical protein
VGVRPSCSNEQLQIFNVLTSYGKVDCLLQRGREDWHRLRGASHVVPVAGVGVGVAARSDAWDLRHRFKG